MTIPSAAEARSRSIQIEMGKINTVMEDLEKRINEAIRRSAQEAHVSTRIMTQAEEDFLKNMLINELGYKVEVTTDFRDGDRTMRVSWSE
jgi:hypothetical protein